MRSVNRVTLVGTVGTDPDARETGQGVTVAHLSLATDRTYTKNGEEYRERQWHRLTFFAGVAETVEARVRKGDRLYTEGRIEYGSYEREGTSIPTVDIIVTDFVILTPQEDER